MKKEDLTNEQLSDVSGGTDAGGGMTREELDARLTLLASGQKGHQVFTQMGHLASAK